MDMITLAMAKAFESGLPCVILLEIKLSDTVISVKSVFMSFEVSGAKYLRFAQGDAKIEFANDGSAWTAFIEVG